MKHNLKKTILRILLAIVASFLLVVISYLLYVVCSYYRVEDNLSLDIAGEATEKAPVGETLTLMTYNIGFGAYSDEYSFFMDGGEYARAFSKEAVLENTAGALAVLQKEAPHLIALQEVDVDGTRSYHVDQTTLVANAFSDYDRAFAQNYDSPYFFYPFHEPIGANRAGILSFSAFNMTDALRRSLPIEESLYKYLDLDRAYSVSYIEVEGGAQLVFYNVHLSAYTSDGTIADEQMKLLSADMKGEYEKGNYVIAAGDFNKDMLGDSSNYFTRTDGEFTWAKPFDTALLPEGFTAHTGANAPTCRNADSPYRGDGTDFILSVDGILTSPNIEVVRCETVKIGFLYSDHDPVKMEFILKAQ